MVFKSAHVVITSFLLLNALIGSCYGGDLAMNFYKQTCSSAEDIVKDITTKRVQANPTLAAKLLRLHFHDCFVRGCDASILLESTSTKQAEKDAFPNLSLGGFDVIDEIKTQIESQCPEVVSCADIVTLAARDAVATLNPNAWWKVHTGRRDGVESILSDAFGLPSPFSNFTTLIQTFQSKGLNISRAHTIGITHCGVMFSRLYFFNGTAGATDPSLDPTYATTLKQLCPQSSNPGTELDMDPNSAQLFDAAYYTTVKTNKGIFQSDAALLDDTASRMMVLAMQDEANFLTHFGNSMRKMASIQILTGTDGQIRRKCSVFKMRFLSVAIASLVLISLVGVGHGISWRYRPKPQGLKFGFYVNSCPQAYGIIKRITWSKVKANSALPAKLLRLHFHDCFVRGCDASILLDTVGGNVSEKGARPNLSLAGYEVIDEIKAELERVCPSKVSCADILALSTRDSVSFPRNILSLAFHTSYDGCEQYKRNLWEVKTGRRDGVVSKAAEANQDIPSPFANYTTLLNHFSSKKLNFIDLVALSGAHTIGVARCGTFTRRLNFTGKGDVDPSLDAAYAATLRQKCPSPPVDPTTTVAMDPDDAESFNNHYYGALTRHQGLFQSDAALLTDPSAKWFVEKMSRDRFFFFRQFAASMLKMGAIDVLTGDDGQIRKDCHFVN
ncbi:hypothetical protein V2J09_023127 [Rumex salicifolius]